MFVIVRVNGLDSWKGRSETGIDLSRSKPSLILVVTELAASGVTRVVLVVAPGKESVEGYFRPSPRIEERRTLFLTPTQNNFVFFSSALFLPMILLGAGSAIWWIR